MDETQLSKSNATDTNLPAVVAGLEMLTVNTNLSSQQENKRILRKRIQRVDPNQNLNRRCSTRPKKRTCAEMESEKDITEYYLDKTIKRKSNTLETIYEENDDINENATYMSVKRYKRMIQFEPTPSDAKLKKRKGKIKKVFGSKIKLRKRHASMQTLLDKLNRINVASPSKTDIEFK